MLELAKVKIQRSEVEENFAGVPWKFGPKVFLEPSFAITCKQIREKFEFDVEISASSSVVLGGDALSDHKQCLKIDGTVYAQSKLNFFDHFE